MSTSQKKLGRTKLRDWINVISFLYGKTLKTSIIDKRIYEKEAREYKKVYNHHLKKRSEDKKSTRFKVEDIFTDVIG